MRLGVTKALTILSPDTDTSAYTGDNQIKAKLIDNTTGVEYEVAATDGASAGTNISLQIDGSTAGLERKVYELDIAPLLPNDRYSRAFLELY